MEKQPDKANNTKLFLKSVRALPEEYITDNIRLQTFNGDTVYCSCPDLQALVYKEGKGWGKVIFD